MIGLNEPTKGDVKYDGESFTHADEPIRQKMLQRFGVMYQGGALFSSMTLAENVGLPLGEYTTLSEAEIREIAALKLALVGLKGFEDFFPAEISGGMWKRADIARAMALDPDILFFDEPSAGLDPISSRQLDDMILELRASLGATIVVVTHELPSIFAIATNSVFLDIESKTIIAKGSPKEMLESKETDPKVRRFLTRGEDEGKAGKGRTRMGRKANPVVIGAFVVGAVALAVLGIVVFGSGRFFADTTAFVMYFSGSVDGLSVGSPVKFKGVEIGAVTSIQLDLGSEEARIPVWIEVDNKKIIACGAKLPSDAASLKAEVDRGLRAQLNSQSIVTGLLFVQLDYHPEAPASWCRRPRRVNEIPTIPTTLEQAQQAAAEIIANLKQVDFDGFGKALRAAIDGINATVNAPGLQNALQSLPETLASLNKTLASVQ